MGACKGASELATLENAAFNCLKFKDVLSISGADKLLTQSSVNTELHPDIILNDCDVAFSP